MTNRNKTLRVDTADSAGRWHYQPSLTKTECYRVGPLCELEPATHHAAKKSGWAKVMTNNGPLWVCPSCRRSHDVPAD